MCKVRCKGIPTVDMDNVCRHLEVIALLMSVLFRFLFIVTLGTICLNNLVNLKCYQCKIS